MKTYASIWASLVPSTHNQSSQKKRARPRSQGRLNCEPAVWTTNAASAGCTAAG
jgi:hypothetical protein